MPAMDDANVKDRQAQAPAPVDMAPPPGAFVPTPAPPTDAAAAATDGAALTPDCTQSINQQTKGAASWLFFVAGATVINAVLWYAGQNMRLLLGLVTTDALMYFMSESGVLGASISTTAIVAGALLFTWLGWQVRQGRMWAIVVAMVVYALDTIVLLVLLGFSDILGLVFHAFVILALFGARRGIVKVAKGGAVPVAAVAARESVSGTRVIGLVLLTLAGMTALVPLSLIAFDVLYAVGGGIPASDLWAVKAIVYAVMIVVGAAFGWFGLRLYRKGARPQEA